MRCQSPRNLRSGPGPLSGSSGVCWKGLEGEATQRAIFLLALLIGVAVTWPSASETHARAGGPEEPCLVRESRRLHFSSLHTEPGAPAAHGQCCICCGETEMLSGKRISGV